MVLRRYSNIPTLFQMLGKIVKLAGITAKIFGKNLHSNIHQCITLLQINQIRKTFPWSLEEY